MFFSIIIPLYNRPQEIDELLHTLTKQTYLQFEVLIIEDGSKIDAKAINSNTLPLLSMDPELC
jgi:glycosyltransferase involved in cell wall biosynthesis